jgi:hypothetical protein
MKKRVILNNGDVLKKKKKTKKKVILSAGEKTYTEKLSLWQDEQSKAVVTWPVVISSKNDEKVIQTFKPGKLYKLSKSVVEFSDPNTKFLVSNNYPILYKSNDFRYQNIFYAANTPVIFIHKEIKRVWTSETTIATLPYYKVFVGSKIYYLCEPQDLIEFVKPIEVEDEDTNEEIEEE